MKAVVLTVFAILALAVITISALVFYPFAPFGIAGIKTMPDAACPLSDVYVTGNLNIEGGWDLRELEITSTWEPVGKGGFPVSGGVITIPEPSPALEKRSKSPAVRIAPNISGEYRLHAEARMIGTFGEDSTFHGWPKVQVVEYAATNTLRLLPKDDPKCRGGT